MGSTARGSTATPTTARRRGGSARHALPVVSLFSVGSHGVVVAGGAADPFSGTAEPTAWSCFELGASLRHHFDSGIVLPVARSRPLCEFGRLSRRMRVHGRPLSRARRDLALFRTGFKRGRAGGTTVVSWKK